MKIIIPTLGRVEKQSTYNCFPKKYRENVIFVVQPHEEEIMNEKYPGQVRVLPGDIKGIGSTRQWIKDEYKKYRYAMMDDDITGFRRRSMIDDKFKITPMEDNDFDNMFSFVNESMNMGYYVVGLSCRYQIPSKSIFPTKENGPIHQIFFCDGPNISDDVIWNRVELVEDKDFIISYLKTGNKTLCSYEYVCNTQHLTNEGGCQTYRSIDLENESNKILLKHHSDVMTLQEKENKDGIYKGQVTMIPRIQWKKAYELGLNKDITEELF